MLQVLLSITHTHFYHILGLLYSSNESTRLAAVRLVRSLCKQSSDTEVCVTISQHILDILMGKGKINSNI